MLLLAYAAGAATSLAAALLIGSRVFAVMKSSLGSGERVRQALGAAVLAGVAAIALGFDTGFLARLSYVSTSTFEQAVLDNFNADRPDPAATMVASNSTDDGCRRSESLASKAGCPSKAGFLRWMARSSGSTRRRLRAEQLRGKVVLVDFWTYSCINCIRTIPYVRAWAEKYQDQGLVVIGVHAPEFAFEKNVDNVKQAARRLQDRLSRRDRQ